MAIQHQLNAIQVRHVRSVIVQAEGIVTRVREMVEPGQSQLPGFMFARLKRTERELGEMTTTLGKIAESFMDDWRDRK